MVDRGSNQAAPLGGVFACSLSFWESKLLLSANEHKRVDETVLKLTRDPATPGLQLKRLDAPKGGKPGALWVARVTKDIRLVLAREKSAIIVLYAAHHDDAYKWAERRRAGFHPATGEFQVIHIPERDEAQRERGARGKAKPLLRLPARTLLEYGVPEEWIDILLEETDEEQFLGLLDLLPEGVGDRVYELWQGRRPAQPKRAATAREALQTFEARQWLWVPENEAILARVLAEPFEAWRIFLHPSQAALVEGSPGGPVKITGSAGTGKTVVAIHRAAYLAKQGKRVLLLSYTKNLCASLSRGLAKLTDEESRRRVEVATVDSIAAKVLRAGGSAAARLSIWGDQRLFEHLGLHLGDSAAAPKRRLARLEWDRVIRMQALTTWDEYRVAERSGRSQALVESRRREIWKLLEPFLKDLEKRQVTSYSHQRRRAWELIRAHGLPESVRYDAVVVDELQDLTTPGVRLVAALADKQLNNLLLIGDGGQRIYPGGFSLRSLGIDVRGRSHRLKINYRTTAEIQSFASKLRSSGDDLDGGTESAEDTRAILRGRPPEVVAFADEASHDSYLVREFGRLLYDGYRLSEIATLGRHWEELERLKKVLESEGIIGHRVDKGNGNGVALSSLHGAKGLEYRAVFVVRCDRDVLPSPDEVLDKDDELLVSEARNRELALLYVGLTRARERVVITHVGEPSEFLSLLPTGEPEETAQ